MSQDELQQLVEAGDFDGFEARCLEMLENGGVDWTQLAGSFRKLESSPQLERAATIGQMVLENCETQSAPDAALLVARVSLLGDPDNPVLRERYTALLKQAHADRAGVERLLNLSGLPRGRAAPSALRLIDLCLSLNRGDALLSRSENAVAEVVEVDLAAGLVTLRRDGRPTTVRLDELAREYERVDPSDFRVLRQLKGDQLSELVASDPVAVVIGLLHAHEGRLSQDRLKDELVPRYLEPRAWSKWWARTRNLLKRNTHVVLEGRSPVTLVYTAEARTLEDEAWESFAAGADASGWLATINEYGRTKRKHREQPDAALLKRCRDHVIRHIDTIRSRRPAEAFAAALVADHIAGLLDTGRTTEDQGLRTRDSGLAPAMLAKGAEASRWFPQISDNALWELALDAIERSERDDAPRLLERLVAVAPATVLDSLIERIRRCGELAAVQGAIDAALAEPLEYPEVLYWLWKGPARSAGLRLPEDGALFETILETLVALGRTLQVDAGVMRHFRHRMRAALALRDYGRARACLERIDAHRAVTLRTQLQQLEGIGDNVPERLLTTLRGVHPQLWTVQMKRREAWEDPDVLWNTRAGIEARTKSRDELVNVKMRENSKRIGEAASHGDLSENAEYKFALEERDLLRARLAQYNNELSLARPIEPKDVPTERVGIGSRIVLRNTQDGCERTLTFLGPFDADADRGIYSYNAPLSQNLMGREPGERVTLLIDGREQEFQIAQVTNGLEESVGG